ncbi:MAG: cytochrome c biogenesis CcdA family protein [Calditerrivibrio sp.]|jgi:cytochrome c-type biogenesis protein|uniref:cytochrome c biogenesis CcdA family protein n=1 Tax=Calditerrivibrio sp. TaxID=2792612 RepID=UPI003D117ED0
MQELTLYGVFFAGLLTFLSPCVLPLLPGYISFISGESIDCLTTQGCKGAKLKAFFGAVFFGLGFTIVFVALGASATTVGKILNEYRLYFEKVAGVIVILLGIHLIGLYRINQLLMQKKWNYKKINAPFFVEAFLLGVAFVLGWTPCVGPILAGILSLAAKENTVSQGIFMLFIYSLGLWIPFLISAVALGYVIGGIKKASKYFVIVEKLAGLLLILIGVLMLTGSLTSIVSFLTTIFPFLLKLG